MASSFCYNQTSISLSLHKNPNTTGYWWNDNNNYGMDFEEINLSTDIKIINGKSSYYIKFFNQNDNQKIYFNETYINYHFSKNTYIKIGKYYKDFSKYFNDDLSSGHLIISNNASPIPKIGFVSKKYFGNKDRIDFDFGIAHGQLKKDNFYLKAPYLHEKFIYLNIKSNEKNKKFSLGLVHEAIWGGATPELGEMPNSFQDFLKVIISADGPLLDGEPHANALGSHIGIWDFLYEIRFNNQRKLKLYYQHYFEDTSSLRFANKTDGLWGVELHSFIPKTNILIEYLNTTNAWSDPPYQRDYYYWNYQYKLGWTYQNKVIGNPLVRAFKLGEVINLGINGEVNQLNYKLKVLRKINENDKPKYKFTVGRAIKKISLNFYILNNNKSNMVGFNFSTSF